MMDLPLQQGLNPADLKKFIYPTKGKKKAFSNKPHNSRKKNKKRGSWFLKEKKLNLTAQKLVQMAEIFGIWSFLSF